MGGVLGGGGGKFGGGGGEKVKTENRTGLFTLFSSS